MGLAKQCFRAIVLWTLLLQSAGMLAVRLQHMPLEARALSHVNHIGAPGDDACPPHTDPVCQTCRMAHAALLPATARDRSDVQSVTISVQPNLTDRVVIRYITSCPLGSRAPPLS